ncbi:DIS3-like exonuclease 2 [Diachasma alloeum]|uniref:DIS3-like exonuclease 2 n=1 Tax=Diachasma alloeum TaxID=454923 RepID=UPI0007383139|nr:DIS3-like exonuclease 2 [Diachasma alloeum]XP_015113970.1 DIS3-like exonuclease 2 [Diachasma alloeum]
MADTVEETRKKIRRGKRGSGKGPKLEDEISRLVQNEVQKYGKQLQKLAEMQYAPSHHRQPEAQTPRSKCWKAEVRRKIKTKKAGVKTKDPPDSRKGHTPHYNHKLTNITEKSIQRNMETIENDLRARLTEKILKDISEMRITGPNIQNNTQPLPGNPQSFGFPKSINRDKMREILNEKTKASQQYIPGVLKISNKNPKYSYVSSGKDDEDILIDGYCDRNRAMEKDLVVIQIHPQDRWIQKANGRVQKTAVIVSVLEKIHPRKAIGILVYQKELLRFHPRDPKFPAMTIDPKTLPEEFKEMDNIKRTLFIAKMLNWSTPSQCSGKILGKIGDVGDLEAETEAILLENGLDVTPYDEKLYQHLPGPDDVLQEADIDGREDWRSNCVFTIDPVTAVDLDDAVSCRRLGNGNFEVGVHIADVTYFLDASSPLNEMVSKRATTIYLANTVYHMLPKPLCQLCSLLPGKDRLTFSVIWELTPAGDVVSHRFTRSIINSCFQMSYQQAQKMIENPHLDWSAVDLPNVQNGFTASDICRAVNDLFSISKSLRSDRFEGGALKIDQPKIQMVLDEATKLPISYCLEERVESNTLIEEFMLLANMTVANHLYKKFPKTALLRHHDPPKLQTLSRTLHPLKNFGVHLNTESAGALQTSMSKYEQTIEKGLKYSDEEFVSNCRMMVINSLCAQAMVRANYICSGTAKKSSLRHYALNVPLYTHFTSPIRRYSDCVVHRLLVSDLEGAPLPEDWSPEVCAKLAKNCNRMKESAKSAQEKSNEIYFTHLIAHNGACEQLAIVMTVRQYSLDVILCHVGLTLKVELSETQNHATVEYINDDSVETVRILWKKPEVTQVINVFTILNVRVRKHPKVYCIQASLLPPKFHY